MRQIKIGFSTPKAYMIGAEAIKMWIRRPYSHTYAQFTSERLQITSVYQASHGMVHFRELSRFTEDNKIVKEYVINLTDEQYDQFLKRCMSLAGEVYGYSELSKIVIYDIMFKAGLPFETHDGKGYICSELIGSLCIDILGIEFNKPRYLLTPADIDDGLQAWMSKSS